ncbi:hypothetical protein HEP86_32365 [Streptomyces sp. RPA4-5]|uniref:hypothetical protein n=1 Tax=unclassified Streptomyces TaxID=2593676 RepID=UPI00143EE4E4|nr:MULTISPECIES: hypothetical protein [unclassified Streptomyces]QIY58339.1 hypothetical protein HEP86_32365 [Streptomyces sp. RPA4-5]WJY41549.1 hypothetical protein QT196_32165 [Streptomyces sp. P9-2B-2]
MSQGRKVVIILVAVAGVVSTPLFWLLNGPNTGQLVGASIQGAASIAALLWAAFAGGTPRSGARDRAERTGDAVATRGGQAVSGVIRPAGGNGSATAQNTGAARADGAGSEGVSGTKHT